MDWGNQEQVREYMKSYRQKNKKKIKECQVQWCQKNKKKIKEYQAQYYQKNKKKIEEQKTEKAKINLKHLHEQRQFIIAKIQNVDQYPFKFFGNKLRKMRGDRSQVDFAIKLGLHPKSYQRYEHGERLPSKKSFISISVATGFSIEYMLSAEK